MTVCFNKEHSLRVLRPQQLRRSGGSLSSSGQRLEVCVPPWAHPLSTRFSASWIACMCIMTLHTASEHSATNYYYYFPLANSVKWHVADGNKVGVVGHLKHIATVRRKTCCRPQLESEHLIFNPLQLPDAVESLPRMAGPFSLRNQGFAGRMCHSSRNWHRFGFDDTIVGKRKTIQRLVCNAALCCT